MSFLVSTVCFLLLSRYICINLKYSFFLLSYPSLLWNSLLPVLIKKFWQIFVILYLLFLLFTLIPVLPVDLRRSFVERVTVFAFIVPLVTWNLCGKLTFVTFIYLRYVCVFDPTDAPQWLTSLVDNQDLPGFLRRSLLWGSVVWGCYPETLRSKFSGVLGISVNLTVLL